MSTTEAENKEIAMECTDGLIVEGNLGLIDEHFADDAVGHHSAVPGTLGPEELKESVLMFRTAFPDLEYTHEDIIAKGDKVVRRSRFTGTHEGEFMGIEPTGKEVEVQEIVIAQLEDGKIVETWNQTDVMGLMQQLGVVEPPSEQTTTDETGLQQRLAAVGDVLASGDAERIKDLYTPGGQLLPPGQEFVTGREAIAEFWQGLDEMGVETIDIEPVEVEPHEHTARRVGRATLADPDGNTVDELKFIEIWKLEDGAWRIHRDIWNSTLADEQ